MPLVSVTRLRIRSWRFVPFFFFHALRTSRQAAAAEGSLSVRVLQDTKNTFWTATAWTDEQAMRKHMIAGAHGRVMSKLLAWCDAASVVHWIEAGAEFPAWPELSERMQKDGRRSKVRHPSADHTAYRIAPPIRLERELRLK